MCTASEKEINTINEIKIAVKQDRKNLFFQIFSVLQKLCGFLKSVILNYVFSKKFAFLPLMWTSPKVKKVKF